MTNNIDSLTRVQKLGDIYLKRDDEYSVCGVCGGKARAAHQIIQIGIKKGYNTFCTAGSRMSPQCEIVSYICDSYNLDCHLFMPQGKETSVISNISKAKKSHIHRTKVGYNSVIIHDAKEYAYKNNYFYIPFGMECEDNIEITKHQVVNIPNEIKRIIVPCGSGMSMISIIKGLEYYQKNIEVVGVVVGKSPNGNFDKFIQNDLFNHCGVKFSFKHSELKYETPAKETNLNGVELDPFYEAKCIPFIQNGDLLWVVGHRKNDATF